MPRGCCGRKSTTATEATTAAKECAKHGAYEGVKCPKCEAEKAAKKEA